MGGELAQPGNVTFCDRLQWVQAEVLADPATVQVARLQHRIGAHRDLDRYAGHAPLSAASPWLSNQAAPKARASGEQGTLAHPLRVLCGWLPRCKDFFGVAT